MPLRAHYKLFMFLQAHYKLFMPLRAYYKRIERRFQR